MRYVGYVRVSHEDQVQGYSLDAQRRAIKEWIARQAGDLKGRLVELYADEAKTATTDNRPALRQLRLDAKQGRFDAVVVHKFDRLARNREQAIAFKTLLRRDLGVKVFSVSEPSEDSDGVVGMLVEGILELVAEWYSKNLSAEFKKGKHEKAKQGKFNGSIPPYGFDLKESVLVPNEEELEGVRLMFEAYSTGKYYDLDIARLLNEAGYRQKSGEPFKRETIRGLLQNNVYLGLVKYKPYVKNPDGSRKKNVPVTWYEGLHPAVISEELFSKCQQVRRELSKQDSRKHAKRYYPLTGILRCQACKGTMKGQYCHLGETRYYRCSTRQSIPDSCNQKMVNADLLETQLVDFLSSVDVSEWRAKALEALGDLLGEESLEDRQTTIRDIIRRIDFRFDMGFMSKEEYLEKRRELQDALDALTPIPQDELEKAAQMLANFRQQWEEANGELRKKLIHRVVEKAWVQGDAIVAVTLYPSYHVLVATQDNYVARRERRDSNPRSSA